MLLCWMLTQVSTARGPKDLVLTVLCEAFAKCLDSHPAVGKKPHLPYVPQPVYTFQDLQGELKWTVDIFCKLFMIFLQMHLLVKTPPCF